jgi:F-type H+-transporting ATPase subunit b
MTRAPAALLFTFLPEAALAAEEAHHAAPHGVPWGKLFFMTVNLVIFYWVLRRFAYPLVADWLHERRARVVADLERAAAAKRDAEALQAEWKKRLANLGAELDELRRKAQAEIAVEREEILAAARRTAETIRRDAERAAEQELRNAQELLRAEVAKQALDIASRLADERLTPDDRRRFVDDFIRQVHT